MHLAVRHDSIDREAASRSEGGDDCLGVVRSRRSSVRCRCRSQAPL